MVDPQAFCIECLKNDIERHFNRTFKSPTDFAFLERKIQELSDSQLNTSTLKRLWGYVKTDATPRLSTLTILARILGHIDWDAYVDTIMRQRIVESGFITSTLLSSERLQAGDIIKFCWQPDRSCTLLCLGNCFFTVKEQTNSKLRLGDKFKVISFREGTPLFCLEVTRDGKPLPNYIAGEHHGISSLAYIPCSNAASPTDLSPD